MKENLEVIKAQAISAIETAADEKEIEELTLRIGMSNPLLLTKTANCPGLWILFTALRHPDSWNLEIVQAPANVCSLSESNSAPNECVSK